MPTDVTHAAVVRSSSSITFLGTPASLTCPSPDGAAATDLLVAFVEHRTTNSSVTPLVSDGWTAIGNVRRGTQGFLRAYSRVGPGGLTFAHNGSGGTDLSIGIVALMDAVAVSGVTTAASTASSSAHITPAQDASATPGCLTLRAAMFAANATTPGTYSWATATEQLDLSVGTSVVSQLGVATTNADGPATATPSRPGSWVAMTVAVLDRVETIPDPPPVDPPPSSGTPPPAQGYPRSAELDALATSVTLDAVGPVRAELDAYTTSVTLDPAAAGGSID